MARAPVPSHTNWREVRRRFPHGVASGDPGPSSLLVWTRWDPPTPGSKGNLVVEVAQSPDFERVVAAHPVSVCEEADWTCRVLVEGLRPATTYWYRFTAANGEGSRVGRSRTAPDPVSRAAVNFSFVSCQNANMGPLTPWRRMIFDDLARSAGEQIEFVLHLGDFVYETVWLPEDRPQGYFDRKLRHIVDYPDGERDQDYRSPTSLRDYRSLYRAYLSDPDLQDARAQWPFICIWDNGEYSDLGWQGMERFGSETIPCAAPEGGRQPGLVRICAGARSNRRWILGAFRAPRVTDVPVSRFDEHGLGIEPNNLAAINSLIAYRNIRWGRNVELFITDQRTFRSEDYTAAPEAKAMASTSFPQLVPFESLRMIDAGSSWNGGKPSPSLRFAETDVRNFRADKPPRTLLGEKQKAWFLDRLGKSAATWKIWADTVATLDMRADPQNLPGGITKPWRGEGYAGFARTDHSTAFTERGEIYDRVAGGESPASLPCPAIATASGRAMPRSNCRRPSSCRWALPSWSGRSARRDLPRRSSMVSPETIRFGRCILRTGLAAVGPIRP